MVDKGLRYQGVDSFLRETTDTTSEAVQVPGRSWSLAGAREGRATESLNSYSNNLLHVGQILSWSPHTQESEMNGLAFLWHLCSMEDRSQLVIIQIMSEHSAVTATGSYSLSEERKPQPREGAFELSLEG